MTAPPCPECATGTPLNGDQSAPHVHATDYGYLLYLPEGHSYLDPIRREERERVAKYLDRSAQTQRGTGLVGDKVRGDALAEAAEWCRDETIWSEQ